MFSVQSAHDMSTFPYTLASDFVSWSTISWNAAEKGVTNASGLRVALKMSRDILNFLAQIHSLQVMVLQTHTQQTGCKLLEFSAYPP